MHTQPLQDTGQIADSEQLKAKIERAEATYEQGEYYEMLPGEDLTAFLNRVGYGI